MCWKICWTYKNGFCRYLFSVCQSPHYLSPIQKRILQMFDFCVPKYPLSVSLITCSRSLLPGNDSPSMKIKYLGNPEWDNVLHVPIYNGFPVLTQKLSHKRQKHHALNKIHIFLENSNSYFYLLFNNCHQM